MSDFPVWADIDIRFRDCDAMGHVNNAVYVTYLEVGRQACWRRMPDAPPYDQVPFVVARLEMNFRSPARVGETLRVYLRTTWIGKRSFATEYEIRERISDRLVAEARTVQTTFDHALQKVIPVPETLRRGLERIEGRPIPDKP